MEERPIRKFGKKVQGPGYRLSTTEAPEGQGSDLRSSTIQAQGLVYDVLDYFVG